MKVAEELLVSALEAQHGLAVQSADIEHLRRHLTQAKARFVKEGHAAFACLKFRTSPNSLTELWIVKGDANAEGQAERGPDPTARPPASS